MRASRKTRVNALPVPMPFAGAAVAYLFGHTGRAAPSVALRPLRGRFAGDAMQDALLTFVNVEYE
jgi:hypothetical protein